MQHLGILIMKMFRLTVTLLIQYRGYLKVLKLETAEDKVISLRNRLRRLLRSPLSTLSHDFFTE